MEHPEHLRNIMVTYKKTFYFGEYNSQERKEVVTKMGFYSKLFGNIVVPPNWKIFGGILLPDGWGGDKLNIEDVIKWEYCD